MKTKMGNISPFLLLFIGILIPIIVSISVDVILLNIGIMVPEVSVLCILFYIIALIITLDREKIFEIIPVREYSENHKKEIIKDADTPMMISLSPGKIYFIDEIKPELSIRAFVDLIHSGYLGLGIIRITPARFRELTGLQKTPLIWLSSQEAPNEKAINPNAIARLFATISDYLKTAERPLILIEGIETLIFVNNFRGIMGFISSVYEKVAVSQGIVIIPISKSTMDPNEWTLLTKNMDDLAIEIKSKVLKPNELKDSP